jgi:hypothetical protein
LSGGIRKQLIQRSFLEHRNAQNLQKSVKRDLERQALLDDRGEDVDRDGDPDLSLNGVLRSPIERLDPKVLLDPSEEQFDLPAEFIKQSDGQCGQSEVVRQERQVAIVVPVVVPYAAESFRESFVGIEAGQDDRLIATQVHGLIHRTREESMTSQVRLGSNDKERLALMKSKETSEIEITAVEDVKAAGLRNEIVQNPHIVRFPICNLDKRRDRASQIEQGMELDGAFALAEYGPWKKRQTQVDRGRIEGIDGVLQFESQIFAGIESPGLTDEDLGKVGIDAPIASFVGVGQSVPRDLSSKAHVIEPVFHRSKTGLDIAKTFPVGQLGEGQAEELIEARKALDLVIPAVAPDAFSKFVKWQEVHDLGEDGRRGVHRSLLEEQKSDDYTESGSNRLRPGSDVICGICA